MGILYALELYRKPVIEVNDSWSDGHGVNVIIVCRDRDRRICSGISLHRARHKKELELKFTNWFIDDDDDDDVEHFYSAHIHTIELIELIALSVILNRSNKRLISFYVGYFLP
jgi:hypothetical protein